MDLPTGKSLPYWKTGRTAAEHWIRKACAEIERAGGTIDVCFPSAYQGGRTAHVVGFSLDGDSFKLVWPLLEHDPPEAEAALRQAATMLYHDVKSRCIAARVFGARWAFHAEWLLPDGRSIGQLTTPELLQELPQMALLAGPKETRREAG